MWHVASVGGGSVLSITDSEGGEVELGGPSPGSGGFGEDDDGDCTNGLIVSSSSM